MRFHNLYVNMYVIRSYVFFSASRRRLPPRSHRRKSLVIATIRLPIDLLTRSVLRIGGRRQNRQCRTLFFSPRSRGGMAPEDQTTQVPGFNLAPPRRPQSVPGRSYSCFLCSWLKRRETKKQHVYIHIYTYIYIYMMFQCFQC